MLALAELGLGALLSGPAGQRASRAFELLHRLAPLPPGSPACLAWQHVASAADPAPFSLSAASCTVLPLQTSTVDLATNVTMNLSPSDVRSFKLGAFHRLPMPVWCTLAA